MYAAYPSLRYAAHWAEPLTRHFEALAAFVAEHNTALNREKKASFAVLQPAQWQQPLQKGTETCEQKREKCSEASSYYNLLLWRVTQKTGS